MRLQYLIDDRRVLVACVDIKMLRWRGDAGALLSTQLVTEFRPQREGVQLARSRSYGLGRDVLLDLKFGVDVARQGLPQHRQIDLYGRSIRFLIFFIFFVIRYGVL